MAELANFLGISIGFCDDKSASPHVHVRYNQHNCVFELATMAITTGEMPPRVAGLSAEWIMLHKAELLHNYQIHKMGAMNMRPIPPLVE